MPLYPGARVTIIQALVDYFSWFTNNRGVTKQALSSILHLQHKSILPEGNLLPDSYEAALNMIKPFLVEPVGYHACPDDCILFRKEYAELSQCSICNAQRFKPGTHIPARQFTYLPIGPRLVRIYGTSSTAQMLQTHNNSSNCTMYDIHDSRFWSNAYSTEGVFKGDSRGIAVSFCTDGVNPFSHHKSQYSMWANCHDNP